MSDQSATPGQGPDEVETGAQPAAESQAAGDGKSEADGAETADAGEVFMNRAARRAHGQSGAPKRSSAASGQFGRRGTVQGPRQWGNRRSG